MIVTRRRLERLRRRAVDPDDAGRCAWSIHVVHHTAYAAVIAHFMGGRQILLAHSRVVGLDHSSVWKIVRAAERHPDLREHPLEV